MREPVSYRCDGCTKCSVQTGLKGWISLREAYPAVEIINGVSDIDGYKHYCGETCGSQKIAAILSGWRMAAVGK